MLARLFLAVFFIGSASAAQPPALFHQVNEMMAALSEITGWKIERKVPSEMLTKEKFRRYVDSNVSSRSGREEVRIEGITLKLFGFVPRDYDLAKETVDLVSEQAAAFYDYHKKRLFILDSTTEGMEQRVALVHELAHALADQHYPLGKYLHKGSPDDDESSARQAVMEGQATWLTWAYVAKTSGGKAEVPPDMIAELTQTVGADSPDFPVFTKAPLYMKESLVFPYNEGLKFQEAVYRKLGRGGFDEVFTRAPESTQQILHPDLYFADRKPLDPEAPKIESAVGKKDAKKYRLLADGSLGEFDFSVLLRQYVGEKDGADAAIHWRGGAYRVYENKRDGDHVLTFRSEWDSETSAQRFFELYQRVMKGRWKEMHVDERQSGAIQGRGDTGKFRVKCTGSVVESIEGL